MTGIGEAAALAKAGYALVKILQQFTEQHRFEQNVTKQVQDTAFEVEAQVKKLATRVEQTNAEAAARLHEAIASPEFTAIFMKMFPEATTAITDERRRMLAAAIASGLARIDHRGRDHRVGTDR